MNKEALLKLWFESAPTARSPYALYDNPPMWETLREGEFTLFTRPGRVMTRTGDWSWAEVDGVHYQWQLDGKWYDQGRQATFEKVETEGFKR